MSTRNASLDALRIDRGSGTRPSRGPWLLVLSLLVAGAGCAFWWTRGSAAIPVKTEAARVTTSSGGQKTLLNASGYVTARRAATVSSKVTGKVVEVMIEEGMKVDAGQVLARLDASNVEASLHLAQAQLASTKAMMEETRPNLIFAQQELKRATGLAATKAMSESELHRHESETAALEARLERQDAEIAVAKSEVAQWQQQLDDTIIHAPFAGVVTSKNAQPGEMISPMSAGGFTRTGICTIVDMTSLEIDVDVNESFINRIQPGQAVEARLDAYAEWRIPAKVIAIIPTADRQKATVKVRVGFDALDPRILPEMGVKVAFQSADAAPAQPALSGVVIPKSAVQEINGRTVVWLVRDGRVERRAITIAQTEGDETSVAAGLSAGERVVVDPAASLTDGARVSEKKP